MSCSSDTLCRLMRLAVPPWPAPPARRLRTHPRASGSHDPPLVAAVDPAAAAYATPFATVMNAAVEALAASAEAQGPQPEAVLEACRASLRALGRERARLGDSAGELFAAQLNSLLAHELLANSVPGPAGLATLPPELYAGVLQYAGVLLLLGWPLRDVPEGVARELKAAAAEALGGPTFAETEAAQVTEDEVPASRRTIDVAGTPVASWEVPAAVLRDPAALLEGFAKSLARCTGDADGAAGLAQLLGQAARVALEPGPGQAGSAGLVLGVCEDSLRRAGDTEGADALRAVAEAAAGRACEGAPRALLAAMEAAAAPGACAELAPAYGLALFARRAQDLRNHQ